MHVSEIHVKRIRANQGLGVQKNKPYASGFDFGYTVFKLIGKNKNHTTSGLAVFSPIFFFADF